MIGRRGGACLVGAVVLMCGIRLGTAWAGPNSEGRPASAATAPAEGVAGADKARPVARDGDPSAGPSAVERLQGQTTSTSGPLELYPAWNAQLQAKPEPFQGALAVLETTGGEAGVEPAPAPSGMTPWLFLVGGVLLGAVGMFFLRRGKGPARPAPWDNVQLERPAAPVAGSRDIQLISSQVLTDNGSVLVVNVCGERLVLGVSGNRDYVTLLTKLGDASSAPPMDAEALSAMMRKATRPAPERASSVRTPAYLSNTAAPAGENPPDEELEVLLDELLGKVRGLKPLAKRADET